MMNKFITLIFLSLLSSLGLFGQIHFKGVVTDSISQKTIEYASVRLLKIGKDTTFVAGASTNERGEFRFTASATGNLLLEITYLGFKPFRKEISATNKTSTYNIGNINLYEDANLLDEAVVVGKIPDVQVKGDTIEYNAGAYTSQESDLLQDIIKRIPGIELDSDGSLKANGKPIKKILVDGKEFFGNDIRMALENLPANMIKKLQLFKEESENAKITGFKDTNENQVLNLQVKEEFKRNVFGDVRLGYGTDSRYSNRLMVSSMLGDNQFSVVGNMNNVSDNNGYVDQMSSYVSSLSGLDKNKNVGGSFAVETSDKFKISGNVRYSDNNNIFESTTRNEYFSPSRISLQNSSTDDTRRNFNGGTYLEWKPDSLTNIFVRMSGGYGESRNNRNSESIQYANADTTRTQSKTTTNGDAYNIGTFLLIGRKLNSKGRNVSLSFNQSFRIDDKNGFNSSSTEYTSGLSDLILDQKTAVNSKNNYWDIGLTFVEPLTEKSSLRMDYNYRETTGDNKRKTLSKDAAGDYSVFDKNYSRDTERFNSNHDINVGFQTITEKYEYSVGFTVNPSYSSSKGNVLDSITDNLKHHVVDYASTAWLQYKFNDESNLNIRYSGSTSNPEISQLSKDTIRSSSGTDKTFGNPDLKISYRNNLNFYYMKSNYETGRYLMLSGQFDASFNDIASYTKVDTLNGSWNTETTYRNVNGKWGGGFSAQLNNPLRNKRFTIESSSSVNYSRNVGFVNEQKTITNNWFLSEMLGVKFKNNKIESRLSVSYSFNGTRNNLGHDANSNVSNIGVNSAVTVELPWGISVQNNLAYIYNSGYSSDFKSSQTMWNANISKQFLKNKKGLLKAQFYDILNNRNNVQRTVSETSISDMRTNAIGRYVMFSFSYRFNFSKSSSSGESSDYMY